MHEETSGRFAGMTLNERLVMAGVMDQWDAAARARDRESMLKVLKQVEIAEPAPIVDAVLADPRKYGF
ncbi:MAG: hypothetical protein JO366_17560 [Methylobacteriaceae bacterium]|nr:hypothetical protein [Methylobacteriaceae bacterium]MBV9219967.1 hypothetical protein [Methylobacteriaceae bacterium]MBV9246607.1 hypothetical protein [Methylobacteriaceae bacterium]MBV9703196.1 hypothetical protein [Methylobacteriaceae bacterium]